MRDNFDALGTLGKCTLVFHQTVPTVVRGEISKEQFPRHLCTVRSGDQTPGWYRIEFLFVCTAHNTRLVNNSSDKNEGKSSKEKGEYDG